MEVKRDAYLQQLIERKFYKNNSSDVTWWLNKSDMRSDDMDNQTPFERETLFLKGYFLCLMQTRGSIFIVSRWLLFVLNNGKPLALK